MQKLILFLFAKKFFLPLIKREKRQMDYRNYRTLWDIESPHYPSYLKSLALIESSEWAPEKDNPLKMIQPHPIHVDVGNYLTPVKPVPPMTGRLRGQRRIQRGKAYAQLSNYNFIP